MIVLDLGTQVLIGTEHDIVGRISAVTIRAAVTYEVTWWDGRTRCTGWFEEWEIKPLGHAAREIKMGFRLPEAVPDHGACARCGEPVRESYPWWTKNPESPGARPIHKDCFKADD